MMGPISSVSSPGSSTYVFSLPAIFARDFTSSQADEQKCVKHNQQLVTGHHHYEESQSNVSGCARDVCLVSNHDPFQIFFSLSEARATLAKEGHLFLPCGQGAKREKSSSKKAVQMPHM